MDALLESSKQGWQPDDDVVDIDDLLPKSRPVPRRAVIIGLIVIAVIGLGVFGFLRTRTADEPDQAEIRAEPTADAQARVHVAGAVKKPGVVTLDGGARVVDAISAAGGTEKNADLNRVNLARVVKDGEQIVVPEISSSGAGAEAQGSTAGAGPAPGAGEEAGGSGEKININSASEAELENLPGVGPVTAAAIVSYREENGPFSSVDALTEVSGIGEATLAKIKPNATV